MIYYKMKSYINDNELIIQSNLSIFIILFEIIKYVCTSLNNKTNMALKQNPFFSIDINF